MAFSEVGTFMAKVVEICASDPKFAENAGPNDYDINILLSREGNDAETDWWRGEMSQNYGKGNAKHLTQEQMTGKTLRKIGFVGGDLSKLPDQLVGTMVPVTTRKSEDEKYINIWYIGGAAAPEKIDFATAAARGKAQKGIAPPPAMPPAAAPAHVPEATVESCQPSKAAVAAADPFAIPPTTAAPAAAAPAAVETQEGDIPADDDLPF